MNKFREQGYKIALDDFGIAPAPLKNLKKLPVDFIKIDNKYIGRLTSSEKTVSNLKMLVDVCKKQKVKVIAKCVETQEQADILTDIGITYAQGYLYGKPASNPSFVPPSK